MSPLNNKPNPDATIGQDFVIHDIAPRNCGGTWVRGELNQHRFETLVFAKHALYPGWELERSFISKLCVRRLPSGEMVFGWDRGLVQAAIDPPAQAIVNFLMSDKAAQAGLRCPEIHSDCESPTLLLTAEIRTALNCILDCCTPEAFTAYMRQPAEEAPSQLLKSLGLLRRWVEGVSTPTAAMRQRRVWWKWQGKERQSKGRK